MATVGYYRDSKGRQLTRILFVDREGNRKTIYLGKATKRDVEHIKPRIEALVSAQHAGTIPDEATAKWVAMLSKPIAKKLAGVGLIEIQDSTASSKALTVEQFCEAFIAGRPDAKPGTVTNYQQAKAKLVEFFGGKKPMRSVNALDADRFRSWLKGTQKLAENTCRTHVKNAKLIFGAAKDGKMIAENPFTGHSTALIERRDRLAFVDRETIARVIEACPTTRWKAIVTLCRFGGLRCPSEVLTLKWDDIDWERDRMIVRAPKTEHHPDGGVREVPLFPEVREILSLLMMEPNAAEYVIDSNDRSFAKNLRSVFLKILKRAKIDAWGKPFQNLRSSRETELTEEYPLHVVVGWLGNSMNVAKKHYLQTRDTDFDKAIGKNNTQDNTAVVGKVEKSAEESAVGGERKPLEFQELCAVQQVPSTELIPPAGFEPAYWD